ncbi:hypothetical protein TNCV_4800641 [Trichonephila clavipes]|nr:hypothetical protein TNCV_4800641 [Trichonephila clavipes]
METVSGYRIHREKAWSRSSKSHATSRKDGHLSIIARRNMDATVSQLSRKLREPGTATNVRKIDHCDKGGLMIWKGITLNCRTFTNVSERDTGTVLRDIGMRS